LQLIAPLIRYRGGSSSLLDYCPVYRSYSNGDCTDESGFASSWMPQGGQERCEHCRCFESTTNSYRAAPSCFRMRCLNATVLEVRQGLSGAGLHTECLHNLGAECLPSLHAECLPDLHAECLPNCETSASLANIKLSASRLHAPP